MAKSHLLRLLISAVVAAALTLRTADAGGDFDWIPMNKPATCQGSIAECMADGSTGEFDLDTESNRRILATTKYISYGALQANNVPCSRRGASYYNCRPGAEANPYTRSCTAATQCRIAIIDSSRLEDLIYTSGLACAYGYSGVALQRPPTISKWTPIRNADEETLEGKRSNNGGAKRSTFIFTETAPLR
ncbi:hypothetical protein BUALT_Bualt02G0232800 [Buddleja alternifolia]|uniref:Rapid alkalinization factor n=1 Tax=Buddleja alternifolia TaxID=168488 RepID=A0AAV6Y2P3_9LAMI|nr:hypothetical protein BUALT_Bualt02G0232800 [Buddleja alternifolia]